MKFKELDKQLLKLYCGDLSAFPNPKEIDFLYQRIKGDEVKKPKLKRRKFKEMISAVQEYISHPGRFIKGEEEVLPIKIGLYHVIFEQNVNNYSFEFRPLLSDRISFEQYIKKYCMVNKELHSSNFSVINSLNKELKNEFNSIEIEDVKLFFSELKSSFKKKEPLLTEVQFQDFINRSFCRDFSIEKPKIRLPYGAKMAVVKLFHGFYQKCQRESFDDKTKIDYLELLQGSFDTQGFNKVKVERFDQGVSKYPWKALK